MPACKAEAARHIKQHSCVKVLLQSYFGLHLVSSVTETPGCLAGFWDEPENLDRELSLFVAGMWTCLQDSCGDEMYYYNQVSFALVSLL